MGQKQTFHVFREAARLNSYAEYPIFPSQIDPQIHLSRNEEPQPFHLICDGDVIFDVLSGAGELEFHSQTVKRYPLERGDSVYIPAGMPHRYIPSAESVIARAKAQFPKLEGVSWYCGGCGNEVHRHVWDANEQFCQEGYLAACTEFNANEDKRTCSSCSQVHPPVDITWNKWQSIANELHEEGVTPSARPELTETPP